MVQLTAQYDDALVFASRLHATQLKKGTQTPYLAHLLGVSSLVLEHGGDEDEAIAALLHDAIEDQGREGRTREDIQRQYGQRVLDIVLGCTDAQTIPKPDWHPRKEAYIARLASAPRSVHLVSASDKVHNLRSIVADYRQVGERLWERFTGGRAGTLWYYRELIEAYERAGLAPRGLVDELRVAYRALSEVLDPAAPKR